MSLLIDRAPVTVRIGGEDYRINSDFRTAVLFEQMMFDDDFPEGLKTRQALNLFYPTIPQDTEEAVGQLIRFYSCGRERQGQGRSASRRCYDFEYDDQYIFAAFLQTYGIDLEATDYLHWWKFSAMFGALPESCEIVRIMGYRSMKISSRMSEADRWFYTRMKRLHALPVSRSECEKLDEIEERLMRK